MDTFKAKYQGICAVCGNTFPVGADIRKVGDMEQKRSYAHGGCTKSRLEPGGPATSKAVPADGYVVEDA